MPARKKKSSTTEKVEPSIQKANNGLVDGVYYLTNEEIENIKKASAYRWRREGYVNLRGGLDPVSGEINSQVLQGELITKIVVALTAENAAEIQHIDISHNPELEAIEPTEELKKLTNLKFLEFKYSKRTEIPNWIQHLPAIETVLMGVNDIKILPSWLTEKTGMKVISLFMNQLEEIESYGQVEELNIASNRTLRQLPNMTTKSKLKDLEAERCDLHKLPDNLFEADLIKCVVNHNQNLGASTLPLPARESHLRLFSATFCGFVEIPPGLIRPDIFVKI